MRALHIHAGPAALQHLQAQGLAPQDVRVRPGAAGGPKGLILGPLDRLLFGEWLASSQHTVQLVGASIGAWRMATACLQHSVPAFQRLEHDYIHQHYELKPGQSRPSAEQVSTEFGQHFHRGAVKFHHFGRACIEQVDEKIGLCRFFECGFERLNKAVG